MATILCVGHITAYFGYFGFVYCSSPTFNYFAGAYGQFCWMSESIMELALALNRFVELLSSELATKLFNGRNLMKNFQISSSVPMLLFINLIYYRQNDYHLVSRFYHLWVNTYFLDEDSCI
uniref:Uncharacterized protein n=1 Tax=Meloidogyne enterolobii TaxID=390850 RepID=A0A6V7VVZ0_MELEN|nr:unnamed protein product [Meloidogyne enterolobii]